MGGGARKVWILLCSICLLASFLWLLNTANQDTYRSDHMDTVGDSSLILRKHCTVYRFIADLNGKPLPLMPLMCSHGGYDECPPSYHCLNTDKKWDFIATIWDAKNFSQSEAWAKISQADVLSLFPNWGTHNLLEEVTKPPPRYPNQSWAALTMESERFHPGSRSREFLDTFDFVFGFRRDLFQFPTSYIRNDRRTLYHDERLPFSDREKEAPIMSMISNCQFPEREKMLDELTSSISIHHYGNCHNNRPRVDSNQFLHDSAYIKKRLMRRYKFCLAIENADEIDYVTEKLWDALESGCIPIYFGAVNVREVWKFPNSFIHLRDYASLQDAVQHIQEIANDEKLFESYFDWLKQPVPGWLERLFFEGLGNVACRMCAAHFQKQLSNGP